MMEFLQVASNVAVKVATRKNLVAVKGFKAAVVFSKKKLAMKAFRDLATLYLFHIIQLHFTLALF